MDAGERRIAEPGLGFEGEVEEEAKEPSSMIEESPKGGREGGLGEQKSEEQREGRKSGRPADLKSNYDF
ncbi:hypothetical protein KM043_002606 [Ampulex compressa]|nr:hypothetical protein KM043_002606 [Ampulex compressa]